MKRKCKNCRHWERYYPSVAEPGYMGRCLYQRMVCMGIRMGEDGGGAQLRDYEGMGAILYVGEDFGCIHFGRKPRYFAGGLKTQGE